VDAVQFYQAVRGSDVTAFGSVNEVSQRESLVVAQFMIGSRHPHDGDSGLVCAAQLDVVRQHQQMVGQSVAVGCSDKGAPHKVDRVVGSGHRCAESGEEFDGYRLATVGGCGHGAYKPCQRA
jgi:hypothetical protein